MDQPKQINFGYVPDEPKPEDWRFGGLTGIPTRIMFEDGHGWGNYLPDPEVQFTDRTDFMDCVTEAYVNIGDMQSRAFYGEAWNKSERFTAKLSGTTDTGNTPTNVCESGRNDGLVNEEEWPRNRTMTWAQYYANIPYEIIQKGKAWRQKWLIQHEWIDANPESFKKTLRETPIMTCGPAWYKHADGRYYSDGHQNNHMFVVFDYVEGVCWRVYDSYPTDFQLDENVTNQELIKELDWNFQFGWSKKLYLQRVTGETLWDKITAFFTNFFKIMKEEILVLFHGNEDDKSKNTGTFWFLKKCADGIVRRQQINSIGAIMMFLWVWMEKLKDSKFGTIKNTTWGEIGSYEQTDQFFK